MVSRTALTIVGVIAGALIGWFTAPRPAVDISVGGVNIQVEGSGGGGSMTATDQEGGGVSVDIHKPGGFLPDPATRALVLAVIGGVVGFGIGSVAGRNRAKGV
jgi:hypothetical protein